MRRLKRLINFTALLLALAFVNQTAAAQTAAQITGRITDANDAVVADAQLRVTNTDTGVTRAATSNSGGYYVVPQLLPGNYEVTVQKAGFRPVRRTGLKLEVAQTVELNFTMEVGAVTELVNVTAQAPLLEAATSSLGEMVNSRSIESLPLNGRNVMQLVALTPGIATTRSYRTSAFGSGSIPSNGFSANGGRNVANEIMVDGSPQVVMGYNQPAYVPNPDATQEFKVQTNGLSAEYGRTGGAVVNLVTRSGTNEFHGALWEFLRNDLFDANGYFNNLNNRDKAAFRFNQFGGTAGGPVYLPKFGAGGDRLYSGKNRTFFFFSYEGVRQVNPSSSTYTVPTLKMRQGDFTEILGALQCTNAANAIGACGGAFTNPYFVTDTAGNRVQARAGMIFDPATIDAAGRRSQFAGNIIPAARINRVGANLLSYYPQPTSGGLVNNFFMQAGSRLGSNDYSIRLDHRFTDNHSAFIRYSRNFRDTVLADIFNNSASTGNGVDGAHNHSGTIDDTLVRGPWVFHFNYGYAYHTNPRNYKDDNFDVTSLGFPAAIRDYAQIKHFLLVTASGFQQLGSKAAWFIGNQFETHTLTGDATRIVGNHTLKFGGQYRLNRVSNFRPNSPSGQYVQRRLDARNLQRQFRRQQRRLDAVGLDGFGQHFNRAGAGLASQIFRNVSAGRLARQQQADAQSRPALRRRLAADRALTWSKLLDDFSSVAGILGQQNPGFTSNNQRRLDKSLSALDQPHTLVANFQYDLPFGKGKRFANNNKALDWIVGGTQRPNQIGPSATEGDIYSRLNNYFNPASFVNPPQFTFGTTGRFLPDIRGPRYYNWDLSILRGFKITERVSLQFRAEMFNAFNHVNFQPPGGTTFGVNTFGVINAAERARIVQFGLKLYY